MKKRRFENVRQFLRHFGRLPLLIFIITMAGFSISWWFRSRSNSAQPPQVVAHALYGNRRVANIGVLQEGQDKTADFILTNSSRMAVRIVKLVPTCSCITVSCGLLEIRAGGNTLVRATYHSLPGLDGPFSKGVSVIYKASSGGFDALRLVLYGDVVPRGPFVVYPCRVDIGRINRGMTVAVSIYFRGRRNLLRSLPKSAEVKPEKNSNILLNRIGASHAVADRSLTLMINVPSSTPHGEFITWLYISTAKYGPIKIEIKGRVASGV